jgi:hypothetical protein
MVAARLNFLACLVRCISSYLDREKADPYLLAQPIYRSCTHASAKQLPSVDLSQARMLMSSTNLKPLDCSPMPLQICNSSSLKKGYWIGEIRDLWGIPFWTGSRLSIYTPYPYRNIPYGYGNMEPYGHVWPYRNNFGLRPQHHHPVQLLGFYKLRSSQ